MLVPAFNFSLNNQVEEKKVITTKLDGQNLSLACITQGGKAFIYTPKGIDMNQEQNTEFLNLNKDINNIQAAKFPYNFPKESLILSSENNLMLYDVETNSEKFNKEIADGISVVAFGSMTGYNEGIIIVGGNCSIFGFNEDGDEVYWNVASDTVSSLCLTDIDLDKENELIVGTEDNYIRVLKNENTLYEIQEAAIPIALAKMTKSRFAFGLENGMVGVYQKKKKMWRAKSQMKPVSIVHGKFEKSEGYRPLIVARQNGQIEIRHDSTGENLYKLQLHSQIVQLIKDDFRQDNTLQIIAVTGEGNVKGFLLDPQGQKAQKGDQKLDLQEQIEELQKKKQALLVKNKGLQDAISKKNPNQLEDDGVILPKDTKLASYFQHNLSKNCVELIVVSSKNTYLKSAILFNDKLFEGETYFFSPVQVTNNLQIPLKINNNSAEKIRAKVMVGTSSHSKYYQMFEFEVQLPKFSNYLYVKSLEQMQIQFPESFIELKLFERVPRYIKLIEQGFIIDKEIITKFDNDANNKTNENNHILDVSFSHISQGTALNINVDSQRGVCIISTNDIQLAGDLIQDLCGYMNIEELESQGKFPREMEQFREVLQEIEDHRSSKLHISADIANSINQVKTFAVKAEDARILGDMGYVRKYYTEVMNENKTLMTELQKRKSNNEVLMAALKKVNAMIGKASNMRMGKYKTNITTLCRKAIKNNKLHQLIHIIETGLEDF